MRPRQKRSFVLRYSGFRLTNSNWDDFQYSVFTYCFCSGNFEREEMISALSTGLSSRSVNFENHQSFSFYDHYSRQREESNA